MAKRRRAFIIGINGQDGRILEQQLAQNGYEVFGSLRPSNANNGELSPNKVFARDFSSENECSEILNAVQPDQIFHAAAVHAGQSDMPNVISERFDEMTRCHLGITENILRWQLRNPKTSSHFFLSSQMFLGHPNNTLICEDTLPISTNHYANTKVGSWNLIKAFRHIEGVRAFGYILFNHASRFTKPGFLAHNLATQIIELLNHPEHILQIKNANQLLDVSHSQDFIDAIIGCGELPFPEDFVLANNKYECLGSIVSQVFANIGISSSRLVLQNSDNQLKSMKGDASKIKRVLAWNPRHSFADAITEIVVDRVET